MTSSPLARSSMARLLAFSILAFLLAAVAPQPAEAVLLRTYITGDYKGTPVIYKARFDPAVKDSLLLSIVVTDLDLRDDDGRMDNIDFVPGSKFSRVIVTTQYPGVAGPDGGLREYDVIGGAPPVDIVASTSGIAVPPASGITRPASIVPNDAGSHYYYVENQFGFDGGTHRIIRVPIAGGAEAVVFDGTAGVIGGGTLVEFSGVEIVDDTLYFFARNVSGPAHERQLYSVPLAGGIGVGMATLEVGGLDRSSAFTGGPAGGVGPGISDGSDELDYDPVSGLLYGTNHATGETIGFNPVTDTLDFYIPGAAVTAAATAPPGTFDGLGMLAGVATEADAGMPLFGPARRIDGIRPTVDGDWLVVIGHEGVVASIDASTGAVLRLFNKDVIGAGLAPGLDLADIGFDDHTLLAPALIPEPTTAMLGAIGLAGLALRRRSGTRR